MADWVSECFTRDIRPYPCRPELDDRMVNIFNPCPSLINAYCHAKMNFSIVNTAIDNSFEEWRDLVGIEKNLVLDYSSFYSSVGRITLYYLLTGGLGEAVPFFILMLSLLTHLFTNRLTSSCFSISKKNSDEILAIAEEYDIEGNMASYPKMLSNFEDELTELDQRLMNSESRLAFCMAQKENNSKKAPISLLFNSPQREPNLAHLIFEMAGIADNSFLFNKSAPVRLAFEKGGHIRNAQPDKTGQVNSLYKFFNKLQNERSEIEEYQNQQGKHSKDKIIRHIYEFAGLVLPSGKCK